MCASASFCTRRSRGMSCISFILFMTFEKLIPCVSSSQNEASFDETSALIVLQLTLGWVDKQTISGKKGICVG